ncbi:MAG: glutamine amidotransferase [bacterium]
MPLIHSLQIKFIPLPLPAIFVISIACVWIIYYYVRFLRDVSFPRLWRPLVLRAVLFISLIILAAGPRIYYDSRTPAPLNIAILLDSSQSMLIEQKGSGLESGISRFMRAAAAAEKILHSSKDIYFHLFTFGGSLRETAPEKFYQSGSKKQNKTNVFPADTSSRIIDALSNIVSGSDESFTQVILLSDGGETTGTLSAQQVRAFLAQHKNFPPVFTAGFGEKLPNGNISVDRFYTDEFAEAGKSLLAGGTLFSSGIKRGKVASLELWLDGTVKATHKVELTADKPAMRFAFSFLPEGVGLHSVRVRVRMGESEAVTDDNRRTAYVRVVGEKEKILYADALRWEFKYLKRSLENHEKTDTDFLLLTPRGDMMKKNTAETLFTPAKLGKYRVIFLGRLTDHIRAAQENAIVDYVKRGGSIVVLGGSGSLLSKHFRNLSSVLPVEPVSDDVVRGKVNAKLTPEGERHPIMRIDEGASLASMWSTLPYLFTCNILRARGSAEVLAVNPWDWCEGQRCPLIVIGKYGKGTVLVIGFEGLWRWKLNTKSAQYYESFWQNILAYLLQVESEAEWTFSVSARNYTLGDNVCFSALPSNEKRGAVAATVAVENIDKKTKKTVALNRNKGGEDYSGCFRAAETGDYETMLLINNKPLSDKEPFSVEVAAAEFRRPELGERLLRVIAEATGGRYFNETQINDLIRTVLKHRNYIHTRKEFNPATSPIIYIFLIVLLSVEWAVRRREGFV